MLLYLNIKMQSVFNDPLIAKFFSSIPTSDHQSTVRELMLLGISAVNARIRHSQEEKQNANWNQNLSKIDLISEIEAMKEKVERLSAMVNRSQAQLKPAHITFQEKNPFEKQIKLTHTQQPQPVERMKITPKITQTIPFSENESTIRPRGFSRHHLDDTEVRKVLVNPYAIESPQEKKKKKKEKVFQHQEEIDQELLRNIKQNIPEKEEVALSKSKRTHNHQFHAESKIKSLIQKDKMKYKQATTGFDFEKYEYSDEEDYYESTNQLQQEQPQRYSNYLDHSSQFQDVSLNKMQAPPESSKRMSKNDSQSDVVSQSSSFSKFSMSSQRETGKISRRKR